MKNNEHFFNINMILMTIFSELESARKENEIELIYDIDATIPKNLRGDAASVTYVLIQLLLFVFQNTENKEVILALRAPKDFLYEEAITFEIDELDMSTEKVESFFEARLKPVLGRLDGSAFFDDKTGKISIAIPFRLHDLGNRRYYRLPDIGMLGKKVLLISQSRIMTESLRKMFKYFLYEVDAGVDEYKKCGSNLAQYDIFVLDNVLVTDDIEKLVKEVQEKHDLKFVILEDMGRAEVSEKKYVSAYLVKPVLQESIFELIVALYEENSAKGRIRKEAVKPIINMEKYIINVCNMNETVSIEMKKIKEKIEEQNRRLQQEDTDINDKNVAVLNVKEGESKAKKSGYDYIEILLDFLDTFEKSDLYFRDIVKSKSELQIKEFAIELKKKAEMIGAERVAKLAEKISQLFVYGDLDMLPVYSAKYHLELKKLTDMIKRYLSRYA